MSTEHLRVLWQDFRHHSHGCNHLLGVALEKATAATDEDSVPCEDCTIDVLHHLVSILFGHLEFFLLVHTLGRFDEVHDMALSVARSMITNDSQARKLEHLLVFHGQSDTWHIVVGASDDFHPGVKLLHLIVTLRVVPVVMCCQDV